MPRTWFGAILIGSLLALSAAVANETVQSADKSLSTEAIARRVLPAIVTIVVENETGAVAKTGSGFFVAPKRIATNLHVISGYSRIEAVTLDGTRYPVVSATVDAAHDLAILDCPTATKAPILPLGDPMQVAIGQAVVAAGSPLGMQGTISTGIVSAKREIKGALVIQTTAPVSPGSSGGPLLDDRGHVIGVNSFMAEGGQNLNFAHVSSDVRALMAVAKPSIDFTRGQIASSKAAAADPNQVALLALLAEPLFAGTDLETSLIGPAHVELIDVSQKRIYLSLKPPAAPEGQEATTARALAAKFVADPDQIDLANMDGMQAQFHDYSFQRGPDKWMFVSTPLTNLRLGAGGRIQFPYKTATYAVSAGELKSYIENFSVYGGTLSFNTIDYTRLLGSRNLINQGAFVSRAGEPSLHRLAADLTKGTKTDQERIQRLTGFVTDEIANVADGLSPLVSPGSTAATILIRRKGDNANKAVLLASLLEQTEIDYLLVYGPNKLWVAVPSAGFDNANGMGFDALGKSWTAIDPSVAGFVPGRTTSGPAPEAHDLAFVERPRTPSQIVNRFTGVALLP